MKYLFNGASLQNGRQTNIDSLLLKSRHIDDKSALLAVVCDGVGSLADGAFASAIAVQMLNEWFQGAASVDRIGLVMRDAVLRINKYVVSEAKLNDMETASTLTALLLVESSYYIAHIGDSRIYCYENETLSILTNDDVSKSGKLTAYIGKKDEIFLQYSEGAVTGKTLLLCSDGLYKRMDTGLMAAKMKNLNKRSIKEAMNTLPQYVIERGEQDNISLALVKAEV